MATLPIVYRTGGLADTIEDGETGLLFADLSGEGISAPVAVRLTLTTQRGSSVTLCVRSRRARSGPRGSPPSRSVVPSCGQRAARRNAGDRLPRLAIHRVVVE
jgi:hypothetical protein